MSDPFLHQYRADVPLIRQTRRIMQFFDVHRVKHWFYQSECPRCLYLKRLELTQLQIFILCRILPGDPNHVRVSIEVKTLKINELVGGITSTRITQSNLFLMLDTMPVCVSFCIFLMNTIKYGCYLQAEPLIISPMLIRLKRFHASSVSNSSAILTYKGMSGVRPYHEGVGLKVDVFA